MCGCPLCPALTGDLGRNPGMCPDWELNLQLFRSQAGTQSTQPNQPGQKLPFYKDSSHIGLDIHPTPVRPHDSLTKYLSNDPVPKLGHILRYWGLELHL